MGLPNIRGFIWFSWLVHSFNESSLIIFLGNLAADFDCRPLRKSDASRDHATFESFKNFDQTAEFYGILQEFPYKS